MCSESTIASFVDDKGLALAMKTTDGVESSTLTVGSTNKEDESVCSVKEAVKTEGETSCTENKSVNEGPAVCVLEVATVKECEKSEGHVEVKVKSTE